MLCASIDVAIDCLLTCVDMCWHVLTCVDMDNDNRFTVVSLSNKLCLCNFVTKLFDDVDMSFV